MRPPLRTRRVQLAGEESLELSLRSLEVTVLEGPDAGAHLEVTHPLLRIGTGPENDLVLTDPTVSTHHLEVQLDDEGAQLRDQGSTNGTDVRGLKVSDVRFQGEVLCKLGETSLRIREGQQVRHAVPADEPRLGPLVGDSPPMRELFGVLRAVATTTATVMVQGETGTGKELVARALHELSGRRGPLVAFDAASADPSMIRADLFGHLEGAFTGAARDRPGAFRAAHGGTLFLDEIGELPLDLQARLLRVLETRRVTPLGADLPTPVDVRVVSATHRDLKAMVTDGSFREDLYHRLAVIPVEVPPLRARPGDVPLLVEHLSEVLGLRCRLTPEAVAALAAHPWPGNVRALRNHLERLSALNPDRTLGPAQLDLPAAQTTQAAAGAEDPEDERQRFLATLEAHAGNKAATARALGVSLSTLKRRLKEWGA